MSDPVDEIETVTLPCPECGQTFTGPARGRANAPMRLGAHRATKHGYKSPRNKKQRAERPESATTPVALSLVRDATEEIGDRSTKPPTIDELAKAGARLIGTTTVALASWAAETDPTITTEVDREAVVDYLSATPEAAREMAYPFARALGRSNINKRIGRQIVDNVDMASAAAEIASLTWRWRRYLAERNRLMMANGGAVHPVPVAPPPPGAGAAPPIPAGPSFRGAPAYMAGVVATGEAIRPNGSQAAAGVDNG